MPPAAAGGDWEIGSGPMDEGGGGGGGEQVDRCTGPRGKSGLCRSSGAAPKRRSQVKPNSSGHQRKTEKNE